METIGLFKSHYSGQGRSTLTLDWEENDPREPDSLFLIAKNAGMKKVTLVDDTMSGYLEAYKSAQKLELDLQFGLRLTFTLDIDDKTEQSFKSECKYIIFGRNSESYKNLVKIWTKASTDGFYYIPRMDFKTFKQYWNPDNLLIAVPFYDSFLHQNVLNGYNCVPGFSELKDCNPVFFWEENELPFDLFMREKVEKYCQSSNSQLYPAQSIYYNKENDYVNYLTFRCILNRSTLEKPNLENMCSNQFSFEKFLTLK